MAEDQDSVVETETTDSTSDDSQGFDFGQDLVADTSEQGASDTPSSAAGDSTSDFDPNNIDWLRVNPDELPEQYKPLSATARNMQSGFTKAYQEVQTTARQLEAQQQALNARTAQAAQAAQAPPEDPYSGLSEEQRNAVQAVREIVQLEQGDSVKTLQDTVSKQQQAIQLLGGHLQNQAAAGVNDEVVALRQQFGADIDQYTDGIKALRNVPNPATQKPYTITEAYKMLSNKIVDETLQARQTDLRARNNASLNTQSLGTVDSSNDVGPQTEDELLTAIEGLSGGAFQRRG